MSDLLVLCERENVQERILISFVGEGHLLGKVIESQLNAFGIRVESSDNDVNGVVSLILEGEAQWSQVLKVFQVLAVVLESFADTFCVVAVAHEVHQIHQAWYGNKALVVLYKLLLQIRRGLTEVLKLPKVEGIVEAVHLGILEINFE